MQPREELSLDQIRLSDLELWALPLEVREGMFQTLRRERPVSFHEEAEVPEGIPIARGPGFWALTKHEDILHVSKHPELFCSGRGTVIGDMPAELVDFMGSIINMDDPRHQRLRGIISRGFTPRMVALAEQSVERAVAQIMRDVRGKGSCNFVREIASPLPLIIICDMMGVPESQREFVMDKANIIIGAGSGDPDFAANPIEILPKLVEAVTSLTELCNELAASRRAKPTEDITSALVNATVEGANAEPGAGEGLSDTELASFFILLAVAGNETTRNAISIGMTALCEHPDQREIWQKDFAGVAPSAVDEIIRWASPVIHMRRTAMQDTEIRGQKIREGQKVVMWYNSANRDEDVFDDPWRFDVQRDPNSHIAFGGPGPHYCLGAHLARREVTIMFREIFNCLPDLQITGTPHRLLSNFIHGIKSMECEFTPS